MVPVNSGFHTRKKLSKDYSQFEHARSVLGRWKSKNIGFKGREIISLPLAPTFLGQSVFVICRILEKKHRGWRFPHVCSFFPL